MPSINGLATTTALTAVKHKIPDVSSLVKKTYYDLNLSNIDSKYITTADYNKFTKTFVDNNIKSKNLINKSAISGFINNTDLDKKKSSNISNKSLNNSRTRQNNKITSIKFNSFLR